MTSFVQPWRQPSRFWDAVGFWPAVAAVFGDCAPKSVHASCSKRQATHARRCARRNALSTGDSVPARARSTKSSACRSIRWGSSGGPMAILWPRERRSDHAGDKPCGGRRCVLRPTCAGVMDAVTCLCARRVTARVNLRGARCRRAGRPPVARRVLGQRHARRTPRRQWWRGRRHRRVP